MTEALDSLKGLLQRAKGTISRQRKGENSSGLRIARDPEHAEIDIVAVHGLGGEGFRAWVTQEPKAKPKSWLEELLGQDVPNARIMTYGYIANSVSYRYLVRNVLHGRALDMVKELGAQRSRDGTTRRPLFFIAHSLGGWIVKRALIISSEAADSEVKNIELSTCGVAFFGTLSPGRSSSPSPLAHVMRRTSGLSDSSARQKPRSRSATMSTFSMELEPEPSDMEWLENQMEAFKAIISHLPRISFYETEQSNDGFVVDKRHSIAGSDGLQIGLKATHSDLVKFQGRDANYKQFIARFQEMINEGTTSALLEAKRKIYDLAAVHRLEYLLLGFSIPYKLPCEPATVALRQDLISDVETALETCMNGTISAELALHFRIVNLWGQPGTGKTTLARHYAELHKDTISFVFWIWAESWETIVTSYLEFANNLVDHYSERASRDQIENDLGLVGVQDMLKVKSVSQLDTLRVKSVVRAVKDWLMRPENSRWMLIFDNVESSYDIFDFIPLRLSGKIILTSRDGNCCSWGTKIQVGAMSSDQGVKLMETVIGYQFDDDLQVEAASRVVEHLKNNPQNISMAAATIRRRNCAVTEYESKLNSCFPYQLGSRIDQSPIAKEILQISAMLSTSAIPIELFNSMLQFGEESSESMKHLYPEVQSLQDQGHLLDVIQHLVDESFIQTPSPTESSFPDSMSSSRPSSTSSTSSSTSIDYFMLNPAARDHVRSSLTPDEKAERAWSACNLCVNGIRKRLVDSGGLPEIQDFGRVMAPHAKACYDDWATVLEETPKDEPIAWQVLGQVCMTQGALRQAIGCLNLALDNDKMEPIDRIQTALSLASLLQQDGQVQRSRHVLSDIDISSIDDALSYRVALARASVSASEGELSMAEDEYETLELEQEAILGPADIKTVSTVQHLANTLERLDKTEEAQALYRRVYISYQNILGRTHPLTLEALEDLAHIARVSSAFDEAESLYTQSVSLKTRTLGPAHPSTAHAIQKLAVIDDLRCRFPSARKNYQRALAIMQSSLGAAHPLTITTLENMALNARLHAASLANTDDITSKSGTAASATYDLAERHYKEVIQVKKAAKEMYSEEQVLATGSKLREMYENESFYEETRGDKVEELLGILREGRRRETT